MTSTIFGGNISELYYSHWKMVRDSRRKIIQQVSVKRNSYVNLIYYHTEYLSKQIHHKLGHLPIFFASLPFIHRRIKFSLLHIFFHLLHTYFLSFKAFFFLDFWANNNYINFP